MSCLIEGRVQLVNLFFFLHPVSFFGVSVGKRSMTDLCYHRM